MPAQKLLVFLAVLLQSASTDALHLRSTITPPTAGSAVTCRHTAAASDRRANVWMTGGGLQLEDGVFLGAFAAILVAIGIGFRSLVLGDGGLYNQLGAQSDDKARQGENARSSGAVGLGFRLPDLDFVEVYGQEPVRRQQEDPVMRLGDATSDAVPEGAAEQAQHEPVLRPRQAPAGGESSLEELSRALDAAVEVEDYAEAAALKRKIDAIKNDGNAGSVKKTQFVKPYTP